MSDVFLIDHSEATELAGLYVLDALEPSLRSAVAAHVTACPDAHLEFDELGSVLPALARLAEPMDAPAMLKGRIMDAIQEQIVSGG